MNKRIKSNRSHDRADAAARGLRRRHYRAGDWWGPVTLTFWDNRRPNRDLASTSRRRQGVREG